MVSLVAHIIGIKIILFGEQMLHRGEDTFLWQSSKEQTNGFRACLKRRLAFPFKTIQPPNAALEGSNDGNDLQYVSICQEGIRSKPFYISL